MLIHPSVGAHLACVLVLATPVLLTFGCESLLPSLEGKCAHLKLGPNNLIMCSSAFGAQWLPPKNDSSLSK